MIHNPKKRYWHWTDGHEDAIFVAHKAEEVTKVLGEGQVEPLIIMPASTARRVLVSVTNEQVYAEFNDILRNQGAFD